MNENIVLVDLEARKQNRNFKETRGRKGHTEKEKNKIITMFNNGYEIIDISKTMKTSKTTIYRIIKERTPNMHRNE